MPMRRKSVTGNYVTLRCALNTGAPAVNVISSFALLPMADKTYYELRCLHINLEYESLTRAVFLICFVKIIGMTTTQKMFLRTMNITMDMNTIMMGTTKMAIHIEKMVRREEMILQMEKMVIQIEKSYASREHVDVNYGDAADSCVDDYRQLTMIIVAGIDRAESIRLEAKVSTIPAVWQSDYNSVTYLDIFSLSSGDFTIDP